MLLVVSLSLVGSWCETTVPPIHRGCDGCPASRGVLPQDGVVAWRATARRVGIVAISVSYANGRLLHRLIEGPEASPEG